MDSEFKKSIFDKFALSNEEMNYVRGGDDPEGDPSPPDPPIRP